MPSNKTRKIIAATNAKRSNTTSVSTKPIDVKPASVAGIVTTKPASVPASIAHLPPEQIAKLTGTAIPASVPVPALPATKPETANGGGSYVNRAATKPQLYGADHQSDRDNAYLRFFASFLRGKAPNSVIAYADIVARQRGHNLRNPLPAAGGKNGCCDRGILSRFDKFGHTVNVLDPADKTRRIGFRFTDAALNLAAVKLGMRDTYTDTGAIDKLAS